ncbi:DUF551 domain-containing protein [Serratia sp. CY47280]|uniref:DUF551 domain-containing protein n=1 Tax=Serratia sp. CY47280 TaxID=3383625 RepID=UPI003FA15DB7
MKEELYDLADHIARSKGALPLVWQDWASEIEIAIRKLASREAQPVEWGSPKTVGQMIGQLKTLDPAMETTALLRMPPDILDGNAVRQVPISISFEKLNGQWLVPYKGEGRKVLAFWAKADHREETERGELFTATPAPAVPGIDELRLTFERSERESDDGFNLHKYGIGYADEATQARWESWLSCRAAMLAQPVSGGYKLKSPEIPDGWIACSERMPEEGDVVLVCQEGGIIYCAEMQDGELYPDEFPRVPSEGREITHWMPLPAAPEGGNDA